MSSSSSQPQPGPGIFVEIMKPARAYMSTACLYAAAKLKVADFPAGGPQSASELARAGNEPGLAKWIDLDMLAVAGGRERTETEYADLLAKAGLRLARVVLTASPLAAIEALKA